MDAGPPSQGLEITGVSKAYGGAPAVRGVSLSVAPGEVVALFGPNGAGKTTLLRVAAGLARAQGGAVRIAGYDLRAQPAEAKRRTGWVADRPLLYEELTAAENVEFFGRLYGLDADEATSRAQSLLSSLGVAHRAADAVLALSQGTRQRVSLARALVHDPEVLLLDEPFEGLDPRGQSALVEILRNASQAQRPRAVLLTTQQVDLGLAACDRFAFMDRGALVKTAPGAGVKETDLVKELRALGGEPRGE